MSKAAVYQLIEDDTQLTSLGLATDAVQLAGSMDTPLQRPFIAIQWQEMPQGLSWDRPYGPRRLTIWVHDTPGDYQRIDSIITRLKKLLTESVHVAGADGLTLTQCDWRGDSADLQDDGHDTFTRNSSFDVVARPST